MSLLKNLVAGAAAVAVYKLVDAGLRKLEREVLHHEVEDEHIPNAEKDAIVVIGSRMNHIPNVRQRDQIALALNIGMAVLGRMLAAEVKERFITDGETMFGRSLLFSLGGYVGIEMVIRPAIGMGHASGHARRFTAYMLARATQSGVRALLD
jgi:hypothetical protein